MKNDIQFPTEWEELQPEEWAELMRIIKISRTDKMSKVVFTVDDFNRRMAYFILKNRGEKITSSDDSMLLVNEAAKSLDWMWCKEEDGTMVLYFDSTVNLFPKWKHLYGPMDHGADLSFGEFRQAMVFANAYTQNKKIEFLNALVGILYRKRDKKGHRIPFVQDDIEQYSKEAVRIPSSMKWGVYVWFTAFIKFLMTGTFIIDGAEVCFQPVFGNGGGGKGDSSLGLNSILFSVAESGVFGNINDTDNTPLLRVMMKLLDDYNKAEAMKKNLKNKAS